MSGVKVCLGCEAEDGQGHRQFCPAQKIRCGGCGQPGGALCDPCAAQPEWRPEGPWGAPA